MAGRCASSSAATDAQRPGTGLQQLLRQAGRLPALQEEGSADSFRYPDPKQIKLDQTNSRLFLPKLGWLRYRNSRDILGELRNVTVSLSGGKWFVSIQTEREVEQPIPNGGAVGIDMGIARSPRSRTAHSTRRSTASSGMKQLCAKRSRR